MTDVPDILATMKSQGWTQGAALLQHWMEQPGSNDPERGIPSFDAVTVEWTLGFGRAKKVYERAVEDKIWTTEDARKRLREVIERRIPHAKEEPSTLYVDMLCCKNPSAMSSTSHRSIHEDRVAYAPMTKQITDMDALTAALGRFGYYFGVSGTCSPRGTGFEVDIDRVGIYIRDSYDFNDERTWWKPHTWFQHLGFWEGNRRSVSGLMPLHCHMETHTASLSQIFGYPAQLTGPSTSYDPRLSVEFPICDAASWITNGDFRDYRERTQRGGDFFVHSDIVYVETNDYFRV